MDLSLCALAGDAGIHDNLSKTNKKKAVLTMSYLTATAINLIRIIHLLISINILLDIFFIYISNAILKVPFLRTCVLCLFFIAETVATYSEDWSEDWSDY